MGRRAKKTKGGYRSGFEADVAAYLKKAKIKFEYEKQNVQYERKSRTSYCSNCGNNTVVSKHIYCPDFCLPELFIETKGRFVSSDRTKILAVLDSSTEINRGNFRILFMRDNFTTAKKRERYTEWCTRHGITCAVWPIIPKGFLK